MFNSPKPYAVQPQTSFVDDVPRAPDLLSDRHPESRIRVAVSGETATNLLRRFLPSAR